ncbi:MAG: PH domain-containing protein [Rhizobiales bacterium]|nr:PH domain-containing protein [Hyphomicrobiales bacterium]
MSYTQSVLQPGEKIVLMARLHWIEYWPAILSLIAGVILVVWEHTAALGEVLIAATAIVFAALTLVFFVRAWFIRWITEFAVTDRRVISKRGFINRSTTEMHMDKIESVQVEQSILGRLLDYGTVTVRGTGEGLDPIKRVAAPLAFRSAITAK